jgi:hypothetical protein
MIGWEEEEEDVARERRAPGQWRSNGSAVYRKAQPGLRRTGGQR